VVHHPSAHDGQKFVHRRFDTRQSERLETAIGEGQVYGPSSRLNCGSKVGSTFVDRDAVAKPSEKQRRQCSARACANDNDISLHFNASVSNSTNRSTSENRL
jgi:hypothetical protein